MELSSWRAYAALDRRVWIMAGARAVNTMGLSLVMAFMGVHIVTDRGVSALTWGVIAAIANVLQSIAQGYAGELSDRIGRRGLITGSLAIRSFVVALLGVLIWNAAPIWMLAIVIAASAMLRGVFEPVAYAAVADVVKPEQRIAAFGLQRMGTNLGWAVGPAMGGLLSAWMPYGAVFLIAGAVLLLASWTTRSIEETRPRAHAIARLVEVVGGARDSFGAPPDTAHDAAAPADPEPRPQTVEEPRVSMRDAFAMALRRGDLTTLLAGTFLAALVHTQLFSTTAIFLSTELALEKETVGQLYTINGVAVLLLQIPGLILIRRIGIHAALIVAPMIYALGFVAMGAAAGFAGAALSILLVTMGEVLFSPAHQTAIAETGDPRRMGRAFGLVGTMQMLGVAAAPMIGGLLLDGTSHDHGLMWGLLAGLAGAFCAAFVVFAIVRRRRG